MQLCSSIVTFPSISLQELKPTQDLLPTDRFPAAELHARPLLHAPSAIVVVPETCEQAPNPEQLYGPIVVTPEVSEQLLAPEQAFPAMFVMLDRPTHDASEVQLLGPMTACPEADLHESRAEQDPGDTSIFPSIYSHAWSPLQAFVKMLNSPWPLFEQLNSLLHDRKLTVRVVLSSETVSSGLELPPKQANGPLHPSFATVNRPF
jgi:hypothetical protein